MMKEFKDFIARGNVMDMAVGIIIGLAFGKIITSFVADILMPPIGLLLGKMDFSRLVIHLTDEVTMNYGVFINTIIDFLIVGFAIFLIVRQINKGRAAAVKACPYCATNIPVAATRCPACTSEVGAA